MQTGSLVEVLRTDSRISREKSQSTRPISTCMLLPYVIDLPPTSPKTLGGIFPSDKVIYCCYYVNTISDTYANTSGQKNSCRRRNFHIIDSGEVPATAAKILFMRKAGPMIKRNPLDFPCSIECHGTVILKQTKQLCYYFSIPIFACSCIMIIIIIIIVSISISSKVTN